MQALTQFHKMIKRIFFACFLVFGLSLNVLIPLGLTDDPKVSAAVDKQTAYQNQEVNLSIRISNAKGNIPAPRLPSFQGFDSFYSGRASHFTFINGRSSSAVEFNYVLVPKSTGVFRIDPVDIVIDGKSYQTEPIQVEVLGQPLSTSATPRLPVQQQTSTSQPFSPMSYPTQSGTSRAPQNTFVSPTDDDNIFLRVNANKRTVYSNEQVLLTYSLLTRYDTRYEGFETEPQTSGFWVEEFPMDKDIGKQTEVVNGKKYVRADVKKLALFPTAAGEYVIKPGSIKASVQIEETPTNFLDEFFNDSFFSRTGVFARRVDKILSAPEIMIVVKPLPEQEKPRSFGGAVGEFRLSSSVDKQDIKQNEPVTLQVVIEGEGNIETLRHPNVPELPDVKTYDADTKSEFFKAENLIAGKKTFEIIFIPKQSGTLEIPPLEFSYFNPHTEHYTVLKTESYQIKVTPSLSPLPELPKELAQEKLPDKKQVSVIGRDIRYIREQLKGPPPGAHFLFYFLLGLNVCLTVAALVLFVKDREERFLNANVMLKRERLAKKNAQKLLQKLDQFVKKSGGENQEAFFDEAERLTNQYFADKLNESPYGLTHELISEKLLQRSVPQEVIQKVQKFYDVCGFVRFGGAEAFETRASEITEAIHAILKEEL